MDRLVLGEKIAGHYTLDPVQPGDTVLFLGTGTAAGNIARICAAATEAGTTVTLDAEEHAAIEPTLQIAAKLRAEFPELGCVVQACLRAGLVRQSSLRPEICHARNRARQKIARKLLVPGSP